MLGTTATANDRVVADVVSQLGAGASKEALRSYRGPLARSSLRLEVLELPRPAERLAWLAANLPELPGSGIVYTLTKRDAEQVASWLSGQGIAAVPYSGEHETDTRVDIEDRLLRNDVKAVVATSALGMGYDKPDLSFVVHYQAPGSVIAYYQQIGRAGRGVEHADIVLLRGGEDRRIQDFFIEQAFPAREHVKAVLEDLDLAGTDGRTTRELMAVVNLGMGRIEAMLKVLDVEGAVTRSGNRWLAVPDADWTYDAERYAQVTALRRDEQRAMAAFGSDGRCLMRVLQEELDDPAPADCGRCSVCAGRRFAARARSRAGRGRRAAPALHPDRARGQEDGPRRGRRDAQDPRGRTRRARMGARPVRRRGMVARDRARPAAPASSRTTSWRRWPNSCATSGAEWLTSVPSVRLGGALEGLGRRLGVPFIPLVERVADRPPQREMANAAQQAANVRGAFRVVADPPPGTGALLDDRRMSGWTLAMVGGQLRRAGARRVVPVALATLL